jgi:hypothetical protein
MRMEQPDRDWEQPWVLGKMFVRAEGRCRNIARSERLLGYDDMSQTYNDMADEFTFLALWAHQVMYQLPAA